MKKILNNKIVKFVSGTIKVLFVIVLISYVGMLIVQRVTNNNSLLGYRVFTIATGSMEPVYEVGDVILVSEEDYQNLHVGDDVTYLGTKSDFKDRIVTHRIVEMNPEEKTLITKGVANEEKDPQIESTQLYGKVVHKFLLLSFLTKLTRNKIGFYFLIFLPLVLVIFLDVADFFGELKEGKDEE